MLYLCLAGEHRSLWYWVCFSLQYQRVSLLTGSSQQLICLWKSRAVKIFHDFLTSKCLCLRSLSAQVVLHAEKQIFTLWYLSG